MFAQQLLPEFDHEMATTRRLLELVRDEDADWQPHPKSYAMGPLAMHIANLPRWMTMTMAETMFDMNPPDGSREPERVYTSTATLVEEFDTNVRAARDAIANATDEDFLVPWTLKSGNHELFTQPRIGVVRSFILNHLYHHRGQLTVYLRLRDIPLPMVYGPTADTRRP